MWLPSLFLTGAQNAPGSTESWPRAQQALSPHADACMAEVLGPEKTTVCHPRLGPH